MAEISDIIDKPESLEQPESPDKNFKKDSPVGKECDESLQQSLDKDTPFAEMKPEQEATPEKVSYLMSSDHFGGYKTEGHSSEENFGDGDSQYNLKTEGQFTKENDGIESNLHPDGQFVLSSDQMDELLDRSYNDTENFANEINAKRKEDGLDPIEADPNRILETQLGKVDTNGNPDRKLGNDYVVRVDVDVDKNTVLQKPDGTEGTNNGHGVADGLDEYVLKTPDNIDADKISFYS